MNRDQTIVALATPSGRGGIAIVRLSGSRVKKIAEFLLGKLPKPRHATFSIFLDENNQAIDEGIALFFPNPHSFTGEDVLELHGHGGLAVVDTLIQRTLALGASLARPGEFSERAYHNNKLDLVQAEAIADLIDATSVQAARSAMRSLQGEFSKRIHDLVESLIRLRMYVEAAIDFAEEEIDFLADKQVAVDLNTIIQKLDETEKQATQGALLREGLTAVIMGEPNVGKSSLLNCLSGRNSAIVTDIPGTTRDVLREHIHIDGLAIHFIDTAGLRDSHDIVEQEGIRRARHEIAHADILICVIDANKKNKKTENFPNNIPLILVRNKIDLMQESPNIKIEKNKAIISLSAKKQIGIELLKNHIKSCVGFETASENGFSARGRHLEALKKAKIFLAEGKNQLHKNNRAGELLAEDLRQAQMALSEITGEFSSDDLLGRIFSSFCVGK